MMSGNVVFVDTNVLIYANVADAPLHEVALSAIVSRYAAGVDIWISRQILREYLAVLTRRDVIVEPKPASLLVERIRFFEKYFHVAEDTPQVTEKLLSLVEQIPIGGKQIHDANIVATMQAYGIVRLLTNNVSDFERFSDMIEILPLV